MKCAGLKVTWELKVLRRASRPCVGPFRRPDSMAGLALLALLPSLSSRGDLLPLDNVWVELLEGVSGGSGSEVEGDLIVLLPAIKDDQLRPRGFEEVFILAAALFRTWAFRVFHLRAIKPRSTPAGL